MSKAKIIAFSAIALLIFFNVVLAFEFANSKAGTLSVSFLDVGQGDSIFIKGPNGATLLIDGGPNAKVLLQIAKKTSFLRRKIDIVLATHPDADHVTGLLDILKKYQTDTIIESSVNADTPMAQSFLSSIANEDAKLHKISTPTTIDLGGGSKADILFPDRQVNDADTNLGSIVMRVSFGEHSFLLSGDSPIAIEKYLLSIYGKNLKSTVLKAGHHGSNTSSALEFVGTISPEFVVYSRGCDNSYGHPHKSVEEIFARFEVKAYDTCKNGNITFETDGKNLIIKTQK